MSQIETQWRLFRVSNALLWAYILLHKLAVPLVLYPSWQSIDWSWPLHGLLALALLRASIPAVNTLAMWGLALALAHIGSFVWETLRFGHPVGWKEISLLMTEGSSTLLCGMLLLSPILQTSRRFLLTLQGAVLGALTFFLLSHVPPPFTTHVQPSKASLSSSAPSAQSPVGCKADPAQVFTGSILRVLPCGFEASKAVMPKDIEIRNESGQFLTIRVEGTPTQDQTGAWRYERNVPLFANQSAVVKRRDLSSHGLLRLSSDSWPGAGTVLITPGD